MKKYKLIKKYPGSPELGTRKLFNMTKQEIENYNRLCAEFLGWKKHEKFNPPYFTSENGGWWEKELKFHSDWNWIMIVVEAIERFKKIKNKWSVIYIFSNM